jgi:hypothetical protein
VRRNSVRKFSLHAMAKEQLDEARRASVARSAATVFGRHEQAV